MKRHTAILQYVACLVSCSGVLCRAAKFELVMSGSQLGQKLHNTMTMNMVLTCLNDVLMHAYQRACSKQDADHLFILITSCPSHVWQRAPPNIKQ